MVVCCEAGHVARGGVGRMAWRSTESVGPEKTLLFRFAKYLLFAVAVRSSLTSLVCVCGVEPFWYLIRGMATEGVILDQYHSSENTFGDGWTNGVTNLLAKSGKLTRL